MTKLTDEQRERLDFWIDENMLVGDELTLEQIKDIQALYFSERALQKELKGAEKKAADSSLAWNEEVEKWEKRFNEAIEVLEKYAGGEEEKIFWEPWEVANDGGKLARDFLSSLKEGGKL